MADILATGGGNITDLSSRVIGEADRPVYALMMEVAISAPDDVLEALETLKREMQVDVTVHPIQADVL